MERVNVSRCLKKIGMTIVSLVFKENLEIFQILLYFYLYVAVITHNTYDLSACCTYL